MYFEREDVEVLAYLSFLVSLLISIGMSKIKLGGDGKPYSAQNPWEKIFYAAKGVNVQI